MEQAEGQQVIINGQQLQVLQMNQATHMIQGANGQQIMVHAVPQGALNVRFYPISIPFFERFLLYIFLICQCLIFFYAALFRSGHRRCR